ncbi:MAG: DUF4197 domain-containing protein [Bacteroidota bacterium]
MRTKSLLFFLMIQLFACSSAELQNPFKKILGLGDGEELTSAQIGGGLKEALELGITKGAERLSKTDGYYTSAYKILLPEEAQVVANKLRGVPGFSDLEEDIIMKINRGAEDAAKKAAPIFVQAITEMTFEDALGILMGADTAATSYLKGATYTNLYEAFNPVITESLDKFDARKVWGDAVNAYNKIPFTKKANPDLDDYVTTRALAGLFDMVVKEELNIRKNVNARPTDLLKKVFAKQDNK